MNVMALPRRTSPVATLCFATFAIFFAIAAVRPLYPRAWLLEHVPTALAVPLMVYLVRKRVLSDRSLVQITLFGLLHLYGAHYTYANTPLGFALRDALDLSRNHYDRIVHFASGVLLLRPFRELAFPDDHRSTTARELAISVCIIGAVALAYEQLEWLTAIMVDPAAGTAFLGTQGDEWDAQKDATAATLGALLALPFEHRMLREDARL